MQLLQAAEAKAYYGLAVNYKALEALVRVLTEDTSITGVKLRTLMEESNIQYYPDAFTEGFNFDDDGILQYPGAPGTEVRPVALHDAFGLAGPVMMLRVEHGGMVMLHLVQQGLLHLHRSLSQVIR